MDSSRPSQFDHREDNPGSTTAKSFSVESMARDGAQAGASAGRTGLEREGAQEHTDFWDGSLGEQQREGVPGETRAGESALGRLGVVVPAMLVCWGGGWGSKREARERLELYQSSLEPLLSHRRALDVVFLPPC